MLKYEKAIGKIFVVFGVGMFGYFIYLFYDQLSKKKIYDYKFYEELLMLIFTSTALLAGVIMLLLMKKYRNYEYHQHKT